MEFYVAHFHILLLIFEVLIFVSLTITPNRCRYCWF